MRRLLLLTVAALAATAPPAAAQGTVAFGDACGDAARPVAYRGTTRVDLPNERAARHDVASVTFDATPGASTVDLRMRLCGGLPEPGLQTSNWTVSADVGEGCHISVDLIDSRASDPSRRATLRRFCTTPTDDVLTRTIWGTGTETTEVHSSAIPAGAWTVTGDTIVWRLTRTELAAAGALGRTWTGLRASTFDTTGTTYGGFYGDTGFNVPTARDSAGGSEPLTVL